MKYGFLFENFEILKLKIDWKLEIKNWKLILSYAKKTRKSLGIGLVARSNWF